MVLTAISIEKGEAFFHFCGRLKMKYLNTYAFCIGKKKSQGQCFKKGFFDQRYFGG
jgi:hypothetical protein